MPRVKKKYNNGGVTPKRDDKLKQGEEKSYFDYGADLLRALSQPLNYAREIGEGNYLPNQAELEAKGISPMESVIALANPADHIYAALAGAGVINDPNYKGDGNVQQGSPVLAGLLAGSAANKLSRAVPDQKLLDEYVESGRYILDQLKGTKISSKIKTGVADEAITVKHGTHAGDLTADKIKLFDAYEVGRRPGKMKAREGLDRAGGFYTARGDQGKFMGTDRAPHQIGVEIPKGSRYIDLSETGLATDGMAIGDLQKMYQDGYDYIIGKNVTGFEEILPLNPEILKSFKYNYDQGGKFKVKKKTKEGMRVKKANQGMVFGDPTPSDQIKKAEEARNFIKLLYGDQRTRDMINRNLRFVDMGSFDENDNYIPSDTRAFLDNPPDISQDTPEFAIPTVNEVIKADISGNPMRFKEIPNQVGTSSATIADYFPGTASYGGKDLYENLAMMYPNRTDELATRAGVANLYADLMSDYSATMGNFIAGENELFTEGYVRSEPDPGMKVYPSEDGGPSKAYYKPRISGLGQKEKPLTMGMGKYQNRMNEAIQVNKNADMGTYVHEMTHAGDLRTNSFNERYIDQNRHYYNSGPDSNEMDRKQENRASNYGMSPDQFASYVATPTETLARLNVLRYAMYKHFGSEDSPYKQKDFVNYTYGQVPTRDMKIFKDQGKDIMKALKDLQAVYPDDAIFEMLNNIY